MALTPIYQLKTFSDLYTAVREELKIQSTDTTAINRIKRDLNIVYLEEVVPFSAWKWLRGTFDAAVPAAITNGTAIVTQGSTTVTLSAAIAASKKGWLFGIIGYNEVYRIGSHLSNSTQIVLEAPYTGSTTPTGAYKIWTDEIYLPSFVRETFEVSHDFQDQPLENCGLQKFRQYVASLPRAEGRPYFYTTNTYVDPVPYAIPAGLPAISTRSSSTLTKTITFASDVTNYLQQGDRIRIRTSVDRSYNGEFVIATQVGAVVTFTGIVPTFESTVAETSAVFEKLQPYSDSRRSKRIQIYPAIFNQNTTLHIDFIREVVGMADDLDEPLLPIGDRTILLYGGLSRAWSRERNPEEAKRNADLFVNKLTRMAGKMDDSIDQPRLVPNKIYLGAKRMAQRQKDTRNGLPEGWGGGSASGQVVTGTALRAAIFDSTGNLVAGTVTTTELGQLSGILSKAVGISDVQTITNKTLNACTISLSTNTFTGTLSVSNGGTGQPSLVSNALLLGNGTSAISSLSPGAAGTVLGSSDGVTFSSAQVTDLYVSSAAAISRNKLASSTANHVLINSASGGMSSTASLPVLLGGTGLATLTSQALLVGNGTGPLTFLSPGAANNILVSNGTNWTSSAISSTYRSPTIQIFSSSAGTYLRPSSPAPLYLITELFGAGAGGVGGGSNGSSGSSTTFGNLTAGGGLTGNGGNGGTGGTPTIGAGWTQIISLIGSGGGAGSSISSGGGIGASGPYGGAGVGGAPNSGGGVAATNTGSGGGGTGGSVSLGSGAGGGSGAYIKAIATSPSSAYPYSVGQGGSGGTAGSLSVGGGGAAGYITITEHYQ